MVWSVFCYTALSDKSDAKEGAPDQLWKGQRWCSGYTVDTLNCCWPTDVHSQRWLSILRELCVIIERDAYINWYFQHSIVSLILCKEYLNMASFKIPVLLLIKGWIFNTLKAFLCHYIRELYTFNMVRFWPTLYM